MKTTQLFITILFLAATLSGCRKEKVECANGTDFCAFVSSEEYEQTGVLIDHFLGGLKADMPDDEKLERLKEWLSCNSCVTNVEIFCNSCIYTYPAQSELRIWFSANGKEQVKILDIIMSNPLQFHRYHD